MPLRDAQDDPTLAGTPELKRYAIVMAHPDDEVLWASSLLPGAARTILCFGPLPDRSLGAERDNAVARLPTEHVEFLRLTEAGAFDLARWPAPSESDHGLALGSPIFDRKQRRQYEANSRQLRRLLSRSLQGLDVVVTHNPWGEYGHEEHVQVFRAVSEVANDLGLEVWVTGYVGPKSLDLASRCLGRLGDHQVERPVDPVMCDRIKRIYAEAGCWTWDFNYTWPDKERFFKVLPLGETSTRQDIANLSFLPVSAGPSGIVRRAARRLKRNASIRLLVGHFRSGERKQLRTPSHVQTLSDGVAVELNRKPADNSLESSR